MRLADPSVRLFVCLSRTGAYNCMEYRPERRRKTRIGVNVTQGIFNRCAKVKSQSGERPHNMSALSRHIHCVPKKTGNTGSFLSLTIPSIEPETSMQNTTIELSSPWQLVAVVAGAGLIMYVTSASLGISSGKMSTTFRSSQNSHCQICSEQHQTPRGPAHSYFHQTSTALKNYCSLLSVPLLQHTAWDRV